MADELNIDAAANQEAVVENDELNVTAVSKDELPDFPVMMQTLS